MDNYKRLLKYVRPYWPQLLIAMACMGVLALSTAAFAYLTKPMLDDVSIKKNVFMLKVIPFAIIGITLIKGLLDYFQSYLMAYVGLSMVRNIRDAISHHLQTLSTSFFTKTPTDVLISRITSDVELVLRAVSDTVTSVAKDIFTLHYALQQVWEQGGDARVILCDAGRKRAIDAFTSIATRFVDVSQGGQASITGAANIYVSDFGKHQVSLNQYGGNGATADGLTVSTVLCIDPSYWAVRYLRKPFKRELARTGDATKYQILTEWGLVARNWKANAKVVACAAG